MHLHFGGRGSKRRKMVSDGTCKNSTRLHARRTRKPGNGIITGNGFMAIAAFLSEQGLQKLLFILCEVCFD